MTNSDAIAIKPKTIFWANTAIIIILAFISITATIFNNIEFRNSLLLEMQESYWRLFFLDKEANIPTWYSSFLMSVSFILLAIISYIEKKRNKPFVRHWQILSLMFLCFSIDETSVIHEMAIKPLRSILHVDGFLRYGWVIPAFILIILFAIFFFKFLFALPQKIQILFFVSGALSIIGAVFLESISAMLDYSYGKSSIFYQIAVHFEEVSEMMGINIFNFALLTFLKMEKEQIVFSLKK